jgi:uncharacterized protein YhaN
MRFLSVSYRNFGPFAEWSFDLSSDQGLHLIYGPNEAGKTSALRGLRCFLFGFPDRTADDFTFKGESFRVHARLANAHGAVLECVRRKGRKDTLRAGDDKTVVSEQALQSFMGGLSRDQFDQLFGLDHDLLREGGREIAAGKGNLGEAIFAAGAGLAGLHKITRDLDDAKARLYKTRGQIQEIPVALKKLKEQQDRVRDAALAVDAYAAKAEEFRAARTRAEQSRRERNSARAALNLHERYRAVLPTIRLLQAGRDKLCALALARILPDGFEQEYHDWELRSQRSQASLREIGAAIERIQREIAALDLPDALLSEENSIDELRKDVSALHESSKKAIEAEARRREMEAKARDIFRELASSTDLEQAKDYRLTVEQTNRIRDIAGARRDLERDLKNQLDQLAKLRRELTDAQHALESIREILGADELKRTVELVTAESRIEDELGELAEACASEESSIRDELVRLVPACPAPLEKIAGLAVPHPEVVKQYHDRMSGLADQRQRKENELRQTREDLSSLAAQIQAMERGDAVPTEEALAAARRERDAGMFRVRRQLAAQPQEEGLAAYIERCAPGGQLIDAVEAGVRAADSLADRLRREADRISHWHQSQSQRQETQRKLELAEAEADAQRREVERTQAGWRSLWSSSGISPNGPEAMLKWLGLYTTLRQRIEAWSKLVRRRDDRSRRVEELLERLRCVLPGPGDFRSLSEALARAQEHLREIDKARNQREQHARDLERLRRELANTDSERQEIEQRHHLIMNDWALAVAPLRLSGSVDAVTVETYLDRIAQLQEHLKDARIKAAQIRDNETERGDVLQRLSEVRRRIDPACRTATPDRIQQDFDELIRNLTAARDRRTRLDELHKQLDSNWKERERLSAILHEAEAGLRTLAAEAGVEEPKEIPGAIEQSRRREQAEKQIQDFESTLAEQAREIPCDEFEKAALAESDGIENAILTLEETIRLADKEVEQAEVNASEADHQLKEWSKASDEAAMAHQQAAFWARRLQDRVAEYVTLHLARRSLDRAVERYRARNQDSMLARAAWFFERLTDGAFATLDIENEDGEPVLKAMRSDGSRPDASVSVDGLSDGTRDQLFLALRLAGIERHLAAGEPMPLIIDDVLVNFDDRRARATLCCIAELSKRTQVLLFTHHRHIVALAQEGLSCQFSAHDLNAAN